MIARGTLGHARYYSFRGFFNLVLFLLIRWIAGVQID